MLPLLQNTCRFVLCLVYLCDDPLDAAQVLLRGISFPFAVQACRPWVEQASSGFLHFVFLCRHKQFYWHRYLLVVDIFPGSFYDYSFSYNNSLKLLLLPHYYCYFETTTTSFSISTTNSSYVDPKFFTF